MRFYSKSTLFGLVALVVVCILFYNNYLGIDNDSEYEVLNANNRPYMLSHGNEIAIIKKEDKEFDLLEKLFRKYKLTKSINSSKISQSPSIEAPKRKVRIFCMILTIKANIETKAKTINRTWAKDCDKYYFIAKLSEDTNQTNLYSDPLPILEPADFVQEVYGKLTDKVYRTFKELYLNHNEYDWYLKADDDTFIFTDNLRDFLQDKNASAPVTFGYDFKVIVPNGYHSGGAGYLLSNEALMRIGRQLNESFESCVNTGTEDVDVAQTLRQLGVYPNKSIDDQDKERFHPLDVGTHLHGGFPDWMYQYASNPIQKGPGCCSSTSISFHYMTPENIHKLYILSNNLKRKMNNNSSDQMFTKMLYNSII